jgi:hypothetical protein
MCDSEMKVRVASATGLPSRVTTPSAGTVFGRPLPPHPEVVVMARSGRQSRSVEKRRFFMVCFDEVSCVLLFGINEGKRGT